MSIEVSNISKLYGTQKALDNVSFEVKTGEVVGFLGPNGAGKSTMMKIITCFIPQTEGDVTVAGHNVVESSIEVRKQVGYLPENNPLYVDMYVKEYLEFVGGLHKVKNLKKRIEEMIGLTGLDIEKHKKIGALSKGYRQRVGLAQALIHDPSVLILDEPTSGLDPNQLADIRQLIKEIGKEKTVMISTHIMQEVEAICDRVIIINTGKIVANKATADLQSLTTKEQLIHVEFTSENIDKAKLESIEGVFEASILRGNSWQIRSKSKEDIRQKIFRFAVENDHEIITLKKEQENLEAVFQKLTK